jgi:hypothetical protein
MGMPRDPSFAAQILRSCHDQVIKRVEGMGMPRDPSFAAQILRSCHD